MYNTHMDIATSDFHTCVVNLVSSERDLYIACTKSEVCR